MDFKSITNIIKEELAEAEKRIITKLSTELSNVQPTIPSHGKPLPENDKYSIALELYQNGGNHSSVARNLGVSINAAKKYYTWLVKNGYLPFENAELSDAEKRVAECIFDRGMSLRETAQELNCSVTNVVYRRDSAIRKGYTMYRTNRKNMQQ